MAVFRVEKTKGYTVMSNHHLQNKALSLKAKGLLSVMLSLPETWDYTLKGLAIINKEGVDAIREAVRELERTGYILRNRVRNAKGQLTHTEYVIYEQPRTAVVTDGQPEPNDPAQASPVQEQPTQEKPVLENPTQEEPILEKPTQEHPALENPIQINTKGETSKPEKRKESMMYPSNPYPSIPCPSKRGRKQSPDVYAARAQIKAQIEYDILCEQYDRSKLDEIVGIMVDVRCGKAKCYTIADVEYPAELVRQHFDAISSAHIQYVFDCLNRQTRKIHNIRAYLLATLFNATNTHTHYYDASVRHDHPLWTLPPRQEGRGWEADGWEWDG